MDLSSAALALALVGLSPAVAVLPPGAPVARATERRAPDAASPRGSWGWPLSPRPRVVRPFVPPATAYGAGHRGVDLAGRAGRTVTAVDAGVVSHVGRVAGRGTVTVTHPSGLRSTYEPVDASVARGDRVARGDTLGHLASGGTHCSPDDCLHLGALKGRTYVDPLRLLRPVRVRLLPLKGQAPDG